MGSAPQSKGCKQLTEEEEGRIFTLPDGAWLIGSDIFADDALVTYRFLQEPQLSRAQAALEAGLGAGADRAVGCLLGLAVGDAIGAPLEFHPVSYGDDADRRSPRAGLDPALWADRTELRETNRFGLLMGQWTDDTAMALCLADSLLACGGFHPRDLRLRFLAWWRLGYNNAFQSDSSRAAFWGSRASIGLGGIIGQSMAEFSRSASDYTKTGDLRSSGNGSLMRNAPVAILYHRDVDDAMAAAWRQSKTTHQGDEAADCARLLTWICVRAMTSGSGREALRDLSDFPAKLYSTRCLAAAEQEQRCSENLGEDLAERDWRWRQHHYRYAPGRTAEQPTYIGSYCMDCLAMALHCVYLTCDFNSAVVRAADLCGDADTVAAVTGQIAGAIYGASAVPAGWRRALEQWDLGGDVVRRAWLLFAAAAPAAPWAREQPDGGSWTALGGHGDGHGEPLEPDEAAWRPTKDALPPLACPCGRRFGSGTLLTMHGRSCRAKAAADASSSPG